MDPAWLECLVLEVPDAVVVADREGNLIWGNPAAERLFGVTTTDIVGSNALELLHPEDRELALASLASVQGKIIGSPIELRVKTAAGWKLVELIGANLVGKPPIDGLVWSVRDLTDRRRWEVAANDTERFRSMVHNSASILLSLDRTGTVESVSAAITRILGHDQELVEGQPLEDLVVHADRKVLRAALTSAVDPEHTGQGTTVIEVALRRRDGGTPVPCELSIVNLLDDPTVNGLVVSAHDITARAVAELELRNAFSLLTATLDSTADGILVVDASGRITSFNHRFVEMWRLPDSILEARDDAAAIAFVLDQLVKPDAFVAKLEELYAQPEAESNDTLEFKDGRVFERYSKAQRVEDAVVGRVWSFRDVTERKGLEEKLSYQAFHDALTGLANKALFQDRLQHAVARIERTHGRLAVLFLDLDNFKTVNDSLGHSAGDELLRKVAELLVGCLRNSDTAARLGGDEFAVLVEDIEHPNDAIKQAERILSAFRRPLAIGTRQVSATVSIGITFDVPGITSDQLLSNADLAMYTAKERGKNRYEEFANEMHAGAVARLEVEADLHRALEGNELTVHYQPIVDLQPTDRWLRSSRPVEASDSRSTSGPSVVYSFRRGDRPHQQIDRLVLAEACSQARDWQQEHLGSPHLAISVNLSSRRLVEATLADDVAALLGDVDLAPSGLILEITESA